ncbi:hypothetical protein BOTBODRAFT_160100 [Botryobasidium botryosum FD-172 SS1]|uniref:Uncharacterized protein n=1 Tax=Botryobasidium botryosum (strain FD-172 SS1) TaxID=930990 RepID=A0A067MGM0_BOTB1|nr:hypothetical protein BOTBODRAFT_160100 [Botryobasidium botryosum FD-172 SS1]
MSRKRIPPILHSELSEYASLIRALRVNSTLDLVPQLSRHSATKSSTPTPLDPFSVAEHTDGTDGELVSGGERDGDVSGKGNGKGKEREKVNWTRWPLIEGDVYVPEWGLGDEIKAIAKECLDSLEKERNLPLAVELSGVGGEANSSAPLPSEQDPDSSTDPEMTQVAYVTLSAHALLERIFALLASHWPRVESSLQNRVRPFGWEAVLETLSSSGIVDLSIIQNTKARIEALYGIESSFPALDRMRTAAKFSHDLASIESRLLPSHLSPILDLVQPSKPPRSAFHFNICSWPMILFFYFPGTTR